MKIIQVLTLLLLCLDFQSVNANSTYVWGDTLHVWATSGLNMREGPGTDFPKMKKLEYGDKVQVIDNYLRSTPLSLTIIKKSKTSDSFVINGHWVRVIIDSQEGYVFDGYLSQMPTLKIVKIEDDDSFTWRSESMYDYVKREIGFAERNTDTVNNDEAIKETYSAKKWISFSSLSNNCYEATTEFHNLSLREVYLFMNVLHHFEEIRKLQKIDPDRHDWQLRKVEKKKGKTIFNFSEELWQGDLYEQDGKIIFSEGACC